MTGHEPIIEMRMNGLSPDCVYVHVLDATPTYYPGTHPSLSLQNGFYAEIHITPRSGLALDFRCLKGLVVHLMGCDRKRVMHVLRIIQQVEPSRVITSLPDQLIDSATMELDREAA